MAELAEEARDLLRRSASRWRTLRASGREWRDTALASQAWQAQLDRRRAEGQNFSVISSRSTLPLPDETDEQWQIWIAEPWRRARFTVGRSYVDVVFHHSTWWSNGPMFGDGQGISRMNGGAENHGHGEGSGEHLVKTAEYPELIEVVERSVGERLGRTTLEASVTIRHELPRRRGRGLHGLVIGDADEVLLSIDRERGVILYAGSKFQGSLFRVLEVQDIAFDETFSSSTFEIEPLPGLEWVNLAEDQPN